MLNTFEIGLQRLAETQKATESGNPAGVTASPEEAGGAVIEEEARGRVIEDEADEVGVRRHGPMEEAR